MSPDLPRCRRSFYDKNGNGLLGIRGHGGWARNKVCDIRGNFGGNGGLGISLDRKALCVFIPDGVGIH